MAKPILVYLYDLGHTITSFIDNSLLLGNTEQVIGTPLPSLNTSPGKTALASHFRAYKVACMCFSAVSGSGPAYHSELLQVYTPSRTLRSFPDTRMLEIQQYKRKTHGFRAFSCFGPHIWNSLPQDLRHCSTLSSFKAKLKTFLFSQYFHPNISIQFLLQSLCVCVCVRVWARARVCVPNVCVCVCSAFFCFCIILYVNCFGRTMLYVCIGYHI